MDFDRSFRRPLEFVVDYTRPVEVVDISGGSTVVRVADVNVSGGSSRHGGGPQTSSDRPRPIPQATYSLLDIPISTSKSARVGCWSSSPIDSDAFKGKIYPNFLQTLKADDGIMKTAEIPFSDASSSPTLGGRSRFPVLNFPNASSSPTSGGQTTVISMGGLPMKTYVYECSDAPKEDVAAARKLIEREIRLGRLSPNPEPPYPHVAGSSYCNDRTCIELQRGER